MDRLSISLQNLYVDLLTRLESAASPEPTAETGTFVRKRIKGQNYWYNQSARSPNGRKQSYIGIETPEILAHVERYRDIAAAVQGRAELMRSLAKSRALPIPTSPIGRILEALATNGILRHPTVLIGRAAFQTYAAMLGIRIRPVSPQPIDADQHHCLAIVVEAPILNAINVLRSVDPTFEPAAGPHGQKPTMFIGAKVTVELQVAMTGAGDDISMLAAYLTENAQPAALLHGSGILANVPDPSRYAWFKLIRSQIQNDDPEKVRSDLRQAEVLLDALTVDRPFDLRTTWEHLAARGRWQEAAKEALQAIDMAVRERTVRAISR